MTIPDLAGFAKLRAGRIHLRCYVCGRKMSNRDRDPHDPPSAVLMETPCPKHGEVMEPPTFYYDANGRECEP